MLTVAGTALGSFTRGFFTNKLTRTVPALFTWVFFVGKSLVVLAQSMND